MNLGNTAGAGGPTPTTGDCPGGRLVKSDSMDSILGDSLLDPPQNINKMTPRRYQSPSRCGSPSLEAPEHLLSGGSSSNRRNVEAWLGGSHQANTAPPTYEQAMMNSRYMAGGHHLEDPEMFRLNRHDLIRRRDMGLYRGMHPRMIHPGMPRLSLPTHRAAAPGSTASNPTAAMQQPLRPSSVLGLPYYSSNLQQTASQLPGIMTPTELGQSAAITNDHRRLHSQMGNDQSMMNVQQQRSQLMTAAADQQQQHIVSDQLPNYCTRSGKHICDNEDFEELVSSSRRPRPPQGFSNLQQPQQTNHHQLASSLAVSGSQYHHHQHSRESSNSSSEAGSSGSNNGSLISGSPPPTGDNYKQCELGAKAKGWTARTGRSSTPYGRDSSTDSAAEIRNTKKGNSSSSSGGSRPVLSQQYPLCDGGSCGGGHHVLEDGELSPGEMDEVLAHLRSRMSPVAGGEN